MDEFKSDESLQCGAVGDIVAQSRWRYRLPPRASFAIAVVAIVAYWAAGLVSVCLASNFLPWPVWMFLYFAHYSACGGLLASVFSITVRKWDHAAFWGAVVGVVLAGLLFT
jgi:hypothetical protein